jgi:DNA-directed RNA polymerase subunit L
MLVQVSRKEDREFTVEVTGEDYSLAEIVHHELLGEKNVTFAGVLPPHPLIKKLVVKVRAQRIKPEKAFLTSLERAQVNTRELLDAVNKATSGGSE